MGYVCFLWGYVFEESVGLLGALVSFGALASAEAGTLFPNDVLYCNQHQVV
jgi:hypothetical protein